METKQGLGNPKYSILNTNFTHNTGNKGGAIYADNVEFLKIEGCHFENNEAIFEESVSSSGNGGSLYFFCNTEFGNCQLDL